jgi:hypothetical protein
VCTPPLALARGCAGGVLFFMIKQKSIRGKMRYSNLSNNMMISELCEQQLQFKYGSQARFCHDRHNSAPELAEHPPPLPDHAGSIPEMWSYFGNLIRPLRPLPQHFTKCPPLFRIKNSKITCRLFQSVLTF